MSASSRASGITLLESAAWTPAGDAAATAAALRAGRVLLQAHPVDWATGDAVPLALGSAAPESAPPRWWPTLMAFARPLAGSSWGGCRRPVLISSSNYGAGNLLAFRQRGEPEQLEWATPHACVERLREAMGWGPDVTLFSHACVTAQLALVQAERLLLANAADAVLVLSFDFLSPFVAGGFHALKILNGQFPAPYTARETGSIGLGDGAAYAVLGRDGAAGRPRIEAQALHNEMHHFTANRADGVGFRALLGQLPLEGVRLWVKGHGTGTLEAGRLEATAVAAALPEAPLVSWKGSLGHTLGSCALVELGVAVAAIEQGEVPGTVAVGEDSFTPQVARVPFPARDYEAALMLSNAFGGAHGGMLLRYA